MLRKLLCRLGIHGPYWNGPGRGRCGEPFVRQCPHCGMRWYGREINYTHAGQEWRGVGDWKTRKQCISAGEWLGDKFPGQKF